VSKKKAARRSASSKPVQKRKKSVLETEFFAGFIGAKAAGSSDEEALFIAAIFDEEE
jgi:hypothetical protein